MTAGAPRVRSVASTAPFEPGDPVAVLGLGLSGCAAARLLHARGARVYVSDAAAGPSQLEAASGLQGEGIETQVGGHDMERIVACRLVITSPGIDPGSELRRAIDAADVPTLAEVEVASRYLRSRTIGITGTNGKTTTTALCGHLLRSAGVSSATAGNIGRPLSDVALLEEQPDWVVVELSSFQLADLDTFAPDVGVLLNLAPDHLDRYPSLERYYQDKRRLFLNDSPDGRWVLNADDPAVLELARDLAGRRFLASMAPHDDPGAFVDASGVLSQRLGGVVEPWLATDELPLIGRHNIMNALLGGTAAALAGCDAAAIGDGLRSFEGLPHRLQPVGEFEGVLWINDSKGTNVSAARVALEAFNGRPLIVILGGRHKGEPYTTLAPSLVRNARAVIAYGEAAPLIVRELGDHVRVSVANGFEEVIRLSRSAAAPGDVVLFSPACSSYDMFPNYEVRGRTFETGVRALYAGDAE